MTTVMLHIRLRYWEVSIKIIIYCDAVFVKVFKASNALLGFTRRLCFADFVIQIVKMQGATLSVLKEVCSWSLWLWWNILFRAFKLVKSWSNSNLSCCFSSCIILKHTQILRAVKIVQQWQLVEPAWNSGLQRWKLSSLIHATNTCPRSLNRMRTTLSSLWHRRFKHLRSERDIHSVCRA